MEKTDTNREQSDDDSDNNLRFRDRLGVPIPPYIRPYCTRKFHGDGGVYYETPNEKRRHDRRMRGLFR
ncbi:MAG: hypothetical protein WC533_00695 [Candidatus Pacearchaeota archaeon]